MKYAEDRNRFISANKVGDSVMAKKQDPYYSIFFFPKNVADIRETDKNLRLIVNTSDDLLRRKFAVMRDVIMDVIKPADSFVGPPYFCDARILRATSSFDTIRPERASSKPLSTMRLKASSRRISS
jgi:hypothetical protein